MGACRACVRARVGIATWHQVIFTIMPAADAPAEPMDEDSLGLPGWLDDMLKPGVGNAVFTTLKASLVGLLLTLCLLLIYIEDQVRLPRTQSAHA